MTITDHLLVHKVISLDGYVDGETAMRLYDDMSKKAGFGQSLVSDQRGDLQATEDTHYQEVAHKGRISETAFEQTFPQPAKAALSRLTQDIAEMMGVSTTQFEPWQCTRYFTGGVFDYHDDCGNWASNERLYTVMLTVRAADFGGETHFPRINITIPSEFARLVIWRNLNEDFLCDGMAMHSGMPVGKEGFEDEKMILVTWIRRFEYVP